jgi:Ca2+-binding EF-hand superfamily protein
MFFSAHSIRVDFLALIAVVAGLAFTQPASAGFYVREEARPMLVKADANRDGYLSRLELRAEDPSMLRGFDRADVDHNGKLDLGEFEILLISL